MVRTLLLIVATLSLLASPALAQNQPEVGKPAPPLNVGRLLGVPDGANADFDGDLKGKVVVLEFWATWCGPCIRNVPHLNELASGFAGEDVVFLSVTAESGDAVEPFVEKTPISGWIGLEATDAFETYRPAGIPQTFIIGRDGTLLSIGRPWNLHWSHVQDALEGKPITPEITHPEVALVEKTFVPGALPGQQTQVVNSTELAPTVLSPDTPSATFKNPRGSYTQLGLTADELLRYYELTWARVGTKGHRPDLVEIQAEVPAGRFDMAVYRRANGDLILEGLGLTAHQVQRTVPQLVIRESKAFQSIAFDPSSRLDVERQMDDDGVRRIVVSDSSVGGNRLAGLLSETLDMPAIWEFEDSFKLDGSWRFGDLESAQAVCEAAGVELVIEERKLPFFVITNRDVPLVLEGNVDLEPFVGQTVTVRGKVTGAKMPTLAGVDVALAHGVEPGQSVEATGELRRSVLTEVDHRELMKDGPVATRGPGTYYSLYVPDTSQLVKASVVDVRQE